MHSYDSGGNAGEMKARAQGDEWTFTGEDTRFTGGFREKGMVFAGLWEMRGDDGFWRPWMDVRLQRVQ